MPIQNATPSSIRLRNAAVEAIFQAQRPMCAHEVQNWVKMNDPELFKEISSKCYDYVRMILSLAPSDMLVKYQTQKQISGIDSRSAFYGLPDIQYDPTHWMIARSKPSRKVQSDTKKSKLYTKPLELSKFQTKSPSSIFFPNPVILPFVQNVDQATYSASWFALTTLTNPNDKIWTELTEAIKFMKAEIIKGRSAPEVLQQILKYFPSLTHPVIAIDVVNILSREANQTSIDFSECKCEFEPLFELEAIAV